MPDNFDQGAREMADLLKENKTEDFKSRLNDDYKNMSREDFNSFVNKIKDDNAQDLAANKDLPGLKVEQREMDGVKSTTEVDVTTPGKIMGNWSRNSETVMKTDGNGMLGITEGAIKGRQAELDQVMNYDANANKAKPIEQQKT